MCSFVCVCVRAHNFPNLDILESHTHTHTQKVDWNKNIVHKVRKWVEWIGTETKYGLVQYYDQTKFQVEY